MPPCISTSSFLWKPLLLLAALASLTACATSDFGPNTIVRPVSGLPESFAFEPLDSENQNPRQGCRSPLIDPRDGTEIVLYRSSDSQGDYEAPEGSYGLERGELLRIDCATGKTLGVVKR